MAAIVVNPTCCTGLIFEGILEVSGESTTLILMELFP